MISEKETPVVVPDDHPNRCQGITNLGQCRFAAVEGGTFCGMHGGNAQALSIRGKQIYDLRKTAYLHQMQNNFVSHDKWRSLNEEVGILRICLQSILDTCSNSTDVFRNNAQINQTVLNITKCISQSVQLDKYLENLIGKEDIIRLAGSLLEAVYNEFDDPDACARIATEFKRIILESRHEAGIKKIAQG